MIKLLRALSKFGKSKNIISISDRGHRKTNQDAYCCINHTCFHLLCVADGLGGHEAGEIAAQQLCQQIKKHFSHASEYKSMTQELFSERVHAAILETQTFLKTDNYQLDAHTTLALAWCDNKQILTAHVGDSRVLVCCSSQGQLWRTRDHSVVQMLLDQGEIDESEMGTHPEQGKLIKSISASRRVKASIKKHKPLHKNQSLVACSDGFWESIYPYEWQQIAQNPSEKQMQKLVKKAKQRAAPSSDNITVQMLY